MSYAEDETPVEPKGTWQADPNGMTEGDGQFTYTSHALNAQGHRSVFTVVTYMGVDDGKPVIQIDGEGDFRINVNESTIYDRDTDSESQVNLAALAHYKQLAGLQGEHYLDLAKLRAELTDIGFTVPQPRLSNSEVRVALKMIKEQRGDWRQLLDDLFDNFNK